MDVSIKEKRVSASRKRVDGRVEVRSFWTGEKYAFQFRLLAYEPMEEHRIDDMVQQIVDKKKHWQKRKQSHTLSLSEYNANAFIWPQQNEENK